MKKLSTVAALTSLALALCACVVIDVERSDQDDHKAHGATEQSAAQ